MLDGGDGAYGFRLLFPEEAERPRDLVALDDGAPAISVVRRHGTPAEDRYEVTDDRVTMASAAHSGFVAARDPASIVLQLAEAVGLDALIHPILTVPISVFARWRGDVTLHAGAFEQDGGAWIVAGRREAGKSTMLASLAAAGRPIVADDLIAVQDGTVWSGPNCVDLRPDVASRFPGARSVGTVGGRERWRISTPAGSPRLPLRGFFLLEWADTPRTELAPLSAREILALLFEQEYIQLLGYADRAAVLDLGALPAWRVTRARDWSASQDAVASMLAAAAGS